MRWLLPLALLAGCAINPVTRWPEFVLMSERTEREIGDEEAKKVEAGMGLVRDGRVDAYVRAVGTRLAAGSARSGLTYDFQVVDMPEANAFALPGGHVYVSRGLLVLMNSEDELAGVVGHEIAHVEARHAVQRVTRATSIGVVTGLGAAVTGIVSPLLGSLVGAAGDLTGALILAPYSRGQEHEADRVGAELVARAGWDPVGLAAALESLERDEALAGEQERRRSFFATHPALPDRVEKARGEARELARVSAPPIAATRADFLGRIEGTVVGPGAAGGVLEGRTFLHPDLDVAFVLPEGWQTQNQRTALASGAPDGRAIIVLTALGRASDPAEGVTAFERSTGARIAEQAERLSINGRPAMHAATQGRIERTMIGVDLTWIVHDGTLYRIMGACRGADFPEFATTFRETAATFRPLAARERAGVRENRLRVVRARQGERVEELVARVGSVWKPEMVTAANALEPGARLAAGQLVKVVLAEAYSASMSPGRQVLSNQGSSGP